jgi:fatty acid desaturase
MPRRNSDQREVLIGVDSLGRWQSSIFPIHSEVSSMEESLKPERVSMSRPRACRVPLVVADDKAMLRAAAGLTRDLIAPKPIIYWADMLISVTIGYGALLIAASANSNTSIVMAGIVSVLALYRALSFIHEVSHLKQGAVRGFKLGWNMLVGIPMMVPSFMYDGIHHLHHSKTRYGTADDPEYLPLALMTSWTLAAFVIVAILAPIGLLLRFAVLAPLSATLPKLRVAVIERYSALTINPSFRRCIPKETELKVFNRLDATASVWAITLIMLVVNGQIPLHGFAVGLAVGSGIALLNQVRTLAAHLWENEGDAVSLTAQYLDSVNVPPPALLPALWAPVGLRYHALHHLLPGLPYHALAEAHKRLCATLDASSLYHQANYPGLSGIIATLVHASATGRPFQHCSIRHIQ